MINIIERVFGSVGHMFHFIRRYRLRRLNNNDYNGTHARVESN